MHSSMAFITRFDRRDFLSGTYSRIQISAKNKRDINCEIKLLVQI